MSESPVWSVDDWSLPDDFAKVEQQWAEIRALLVDDARFARRSDGVSGWSCGEHAGHLALVSNGIARGIEKNLAQPDRNVDGGWDERAEPILVEGDFPRGAAVAPEYVDPVGRDREAFLAALDDAERRWAALGRRESEVAECPAKFPHFILGHMTSAQWVRFCGIHSAHHLAVVRDIEEVVAET